MESMPKRKLVSFGMHIGTCLENVIGSNHLLNAYFYGQDIDIACQLQKANEIYNTNL
jgi:hypothetical protein